MPYFVIECSENILQHITPESLMSLIYETTLDTGLFTPDDMKVVIQPYSHYKLADENKSLSMFSDTLWKEEQGNRKINFLFSLLTV